MVNFEKDDKIKIVYPKSKIYADYTHDPIIGIIKTVFKKTGKLKVRNITHAPLLTDFMIDPKTAKEKGITITKIK